MPSSFPDAQATGPPEDSQGSSNEETRRLNDVLYRLTTTQEKYVQSLLRIQELSDANAKLETENKELKAKASEGNSSSVSTSSAASVPEEDRRSQLWNEADAVALLGVPFGQLPVEKLLVDRKQKPLPKATVGVIRRSVRHLTAGLVELAEGDDRRDPLNKSNKKTLAYFTKRHPVALGKAATAIESANPEVRSKSAYKAMKLIQRRFRDGIKKQTRRSRTAGNAEGVRADESQGSDDADSGSDEDSHDDHSAVQLNAEHHFTDSSPRLIDSYDTFALPQSPSKVSPHTDERHPLLAAI